MKQDVDDVESDFYSILGVSPRADRRVIKQAYYSIMREYHPDSGADSTEFCAMLNDIYATLSDPGKRSVYNDMAGFSESAINPFLDASAEADLVFVDEASCIGCTNCCAVCPTTFALEDDFGRARVMNQRVDGNEKLQEAIDTCPVSCIHWVTAGQLPLLEVAMAKMEQSPVWSLLSGGGRGECVFSEANLAWAKRRSILREQVLASQAEPGSRSATSKPPTNRNWWFWNNPLVDLAGAGGAARYTAPRYTYTGASSNRSYASTDSDDDASSGGGDGGFGSGGFSSSGSWDEEAERTKGGPVGVREAKDIAGLAARASRTARTWRKYQEVVQSSRGGRRALPPAV
ncbi:MAG: hypothetical protein WDW38_002008 [Sanguina aurantia]